MTNDQLIASIADVEYLTTPQILAVIEFAISLCGDHPASSVLGALFQRIAVDDVMFLKLHEKENHVIHH